MVLKRFVYGRFVHPHQRAQVPALPFLDTDRVALEIVREYGPNELIGKVSVRSVSQQWALLDPTRAEELEWMKWYKRLPAQTRTAGKMFYFDMEGSGHWAVLHFRTESDETGVYVAAALRYVGF